ncbi:MAG: hypothetical protein JKY90_05665 [Gammaproteobacteria bacterium]|nr:hypothetical protein [Gammaproteobacteria bacterium]
MSYCRNSWMGMLANMIPLVVMTLLVTSLVLTGGKANAEYPNSAAQFSADSTLNSADTIVFVSAAQLIDSVSKDAIAVDKRYLREVAEIDSIIRYKLTQKLGLGVRFDGTSQDDILEPTLFMGFRSRW